MLKKLREIPTDNRDIGQVPYEHIGTSVGTNHGKILGPIRIVNPSMFVLKKGHHGISLYI